MDDDCSDDDSPKNFKDIGAKINKNQSRNPFHHFGSAFAAGPFLPGWPTPGPLIESESLAFENARISDFRQIFEENVDLPAMDESDIQAEESINYLEAEDDGQLESLSSQSHQISIPINPINNHPDFNSGIFRKISNDNQEKLTIFNPNYSGNFNSDEMPRVPRTLSHFGADGQREDQEPTETPTNKIVAVPDQKTDFFTQKNILNDGSRLLRFEELPELQTFWDVFQEKKSKNPLYNLLDFSSAFLIFFIRITAFRIKPEDRQIVFDEFVKFIPDKMMQEIFSFILIKYSLRESRNKNDESKSVRNIIINKLKQKIKTKVNDIIKKLQNTLSESVGIRISFEHGKIKGHVQSLAKMLMSDDELIKSLAAGELQDPFNQIEDLREITTTLKTKVSYLNKFLPQVQDSINKLFFSDEFEKLFAESRRI